MVEIFPTFRRICASFWYNHTNNGKDAKFGSSEADIMECIRTKCHQAKSSWTYHPPLRIKSSQDIMPPGEHSYITASALFCANLILVKCIFGASSDISPPHEHIK